jgi:M-phase inducer tyrosine phosphatase
MMATMLSSPIGPSHGTGRYDPFDQPSSPSYKHDELPSEFGDQSFGSSMSLGSSFELSRMVASSSSSSQLSISALTTQRNRNDDQATIRISRRSPPRYGQDSLGAAMGTVLNSRSPGLASKMSPVDYMDMSSPPSQKAINTPSKASRGLADEDDDLPPGSAMKEDTPVRMTSLASESSTMTGGSLGRLFGTELSQNTRILSLQTTSGHLGEETFELQISPDKEPPQKKRPSSLPLSHAAAPVRPSLRSVGMAPPSGSGVASR